MLDAPPEPSSGTRHLLQAAGEASGEGRGPPLLVHRLGRRKQLPQARAALRGWMTAQPGTPAVLAAPFTGAHAPQLPLPSPASAQPPE